VNGVSHSVREVNGDRADHFSWRVVASSDGSHLVGLDDLGVSIWDLRDRTRVVDLPRSPLSDWIDPIAWSRDERWIAAGMRNGRIELWSRDGHAIAVAARHDDEVEELAFSRDGTALASSGKDGVVHVTDVATGDLFGSVTLVDDRALHLWWSPSQLVIDTARGFQIIVRRR
jgi:WD40 repeat protein